MTQDWTTRTTIEARGSENKAMIVVVVALRTGKLFMCSTNRTGEHICIIVAQLILASSSNHCTSIDVPVLQHSAKCIEPASHRYNTE